MRRGTCPVCGYEGLLGRAGKTARHFQMRVKVGPMGAPMEYPSNTRCSGEGQPAEPLVDRPEVLDALEQKLCKRTACRKWFTPNVNQQRYCGARCRDIAAIERKEVAA